MRSYLSFLLSNDLDTLYRYLDSARDELRYYKQSGADPEEVAQAQEHVDSILAAISTKEKETEE